MLISVEGSGENQLEPDQESMGDISMLWRSLLRNAWPKPTGVLEHFLVKEKPSVGSRFFGEFSSDHIPKATNFSIHSSDSCKLYKQFSVNFASEFQERSEASTPVFCAAFGTNSDYLRDFKLPPRCRWDHFSGMLRSVDWWLATFRDSLSVSFSRVRELNKALTDWLARWIVSENCSVRNHCLGLVLNDE